MEGDLLLAMLLKKKKKRRRIVVYMIQMLLLLPLLLQHNQQLSHDSGNSHVAALLLFSLVTVCESFHRFQVFSIGSTTHLYCYVAGCEEALKPFLSFLFLGKFPLPQKGQLKLLVCRNRTTEITSVVMAKIKLTSSWLNEDIGRWPTFFTYYSKL